MQRVHLEPNIAALPLEKVSTAQIEALATRQMLDDGGWRQRPCETC